MGTLTSLVPLDRNGRQAMKVYGLNLLRGLSRNPDPDDLRFLEPALPWTEVTAGADGILFEGCGSDEKAWAQVRSAANTDGAGLSVWFEAGFDNLTKDVASALAMRCGPMALVPDTGDDPVLIPQFKPLTRVAIKGDGSTVPPIPDRCWMLVAQDHDLLSIGVWERGDFGGSIQPPTNEAELLIEAKTYVSEHAPHLLRSVKACHLMCWPEIIARAVFAPGVFVGPAA